MVKICGKSVAILATSLLVMLTACQEKDLYDGGGDEGNSDNPSLNDYSTIQKVKFNLTYDVPEGYVATFDVYAEYPFIEEEFVNENGSKSKRAVLRTDIDPINGGISISGKYNLEKKNYPLTSVMYMFTHPACLYQRL